MTCHAFHGLSSRYCRISIKILWHVLIQYLTPGIQWASLSRVCELWGAWEDWGYCGAGKETEEVLVNGGHHCWLVKRRQGGKLPTKFEASFYARFQRILKVTEVTLFRTVNEKIWTQYTLLWVHFSWYFMKTVNFTQKVYSFDEIREVYSRKRIILQLLFTHNKCHLL